jgi:hypothetical protein
MSTTRAYVLNRVLVKFDRSDLHDSPQLERRVRNRSSHGAQRLSPEIEPDTRKAPLCRAFRVGDTGLEPVTSALSRRRSPS